MNTVRLNITLPKKLGKQLTRISNKSAFIAQALIEKLSQKEKEKKLLKLKEAYRQASFEETQLTQEWDQTLTDI